MTTTSVSFDESLQLDEAGNKHKMQQPCGFPPEEGRSYRRRRAVSAPNIRTHMLEIAGHTLPHDGDTLSPMPPSSPQPPTPDDLLSLEEARLGPSRSRGGDPESARSEEFDHAMEDPRSTGGACPPAPDCPQNLAALDDLVRLNYFYGDLNGGIFDLPPPHDTELLINGTNLMPAESALVMATIAHHQPQCPVPANASITTGMHVVAALSPLRLPARAEPTRDNFASFDDYFRYLEDGKGSASEADPTVRVRGRDGSFGPEHRESLPERAGVDGPGVKFHGPSSALLLMAAEEDARDGDKDERHPR